MNYERISGQFLLLDTNVVIHFGQYSVFYAGFFEQLVAYDVQPVISQVVRTELLAYARNDTEKQKTIELIERLVRGEELQGLLPFRAEWFPLAIELSERYRTAGITVRQIKLPDLLIGAEMIQYDLGGKLFLATENHQDFPIPVFERIGIETVDCQKAGINTIGIYKLARVDTDF